MQRFGLNNLYGVSAAALVPLFARPVPVSISRTNRILKKEFAFVFGIHADFRFLPCILPVTIHAKYKASAGVNA
jgi:hypothetical protein